MGHATGGMIPPARWGRLPLVFGRGQGAHARPNARETPGSGPQTSPYEPVIFEISQATGS